MNSFIHSCLRGALKGLLRLAAGIFFVGLIIVGMIWLITRPRPQWEIDAAAARTPSASYTPTPARVATAPISPKSFQTLIADLYQVETSRFIEPDLMWVTFGPGEYAIQKKCQAIANVWAIRNGADYFRVECWSGNIRLGQGTVVNGEIRTP